MTDDTPASAELSDLVKARREELGLSLRKVEERTQPSDGSPPAVKYKWIWRLERQDPDIAVPREPELRALAAALELPYSMIADAAASQFFGVQRVYDKDRRRRALVRQVDRMTPEQIAQMWKLMDVVMPPDDQKPS